jgi:hypothetical protein
MVYGDIPFIEDNEIINCKIKLEDNLSKGKTISK